MSFSIFRHFTRLVDKIRYFGAAGATEYIHIFEDPPNPLLNYVTRKLEWNLKSDVNKLIDHYLDYACGAGRAIPAEIF